MPVEKMSESFLLWFTLAILLFWGVGVYNRLMRMRARALSALGSVEKHLRQYAELLQEMSPSATPIHSAHLDETGVEWINLAAALKKVDHAMTGPRSMALDPEALSNLAHAHEELQRVWFALCFVPVELAGPAMPEVMRSQWDAIAQRVDTSRGGLNQILEKYNAALRQFPASVVVPLMGFRPAGLL